MEGENPKDGTLGPLGRSIRIMTKSWKRGKITRGNGNIQGGVGSGEGVGWRGYRGRSEQCGEVAGKKTG